MFALSLLITPPAQQKGPLNSYCVHDISIVVGASLAARPGAEKLRLEKKKKKRKLQWAPGRKRKRLHSFPKYYLETDSIPFSCWPVLFGCYFSSTIVHQHTRKVYSTAAELGFLSTRLCFRAPPPTENRHISQSNFQNNSLMLFPSRRNRRLVFVLL